MTFAAAIFDFDGTLVDTMPLHYEAYRRVLADVGIELSSSDFYDNVGGKAAETIPRFLRGRPCPISAEEVHARKKRVLSELLGVAELPVLEAAKLVPLLRQHVRVALASSGSRPGIEQMLDRLGWTSWFEVVVTGEDAEHGKPAPELFLLAARRLSVPAAECLVFEDTNDGVAAARAAGMAWFDVRRATVPLRGGGR